MANGVLVIKEDTFNGVRASLKGSSEGSTKDPMDTQRSVRRPLQGMEIKRDKYAVIRVLSNEGRINSDLVNSSAPQMNVNYTSNLMIQSVQESRQEKSQIIQTFGEDFVYFLGEQPSQIQIAAQLLDSQNFQWHQEWWVNYSNALRGTRLVDKSSRVFLEVDDIMFEGYILSASTSRAADDHLRVNLTFSMLITNKIYLSEIRNKYLPPSRLTEDQIRAVANSDYTESSASKLKQAEELKSAVDAVAQASKGVPSSTRRSAVVIQKAVGESGSTVKGTSDYLEAVYAKLVEYSEKPYFVTRSAAEYPESGGGSSISSSSTESDTSTPISKLDRQDQAVFKDLITPSVAEQVNQSTPAHKRSDSDLDSLRGDPNSRVVEPILDNVLSPRGPLPYEVDRVSIPTADNPTSIGDDVRDAASGGPRNTGNPRIPEGNVVREILPGSIMDTLRGATADFLPIELTTSEEEDTSTVPTPSGGNVGYDPNNNTIPLSSNNLPSDTRGVDVLRAVPLVLYSGEEVKRVSLPRVLV